MSGRRAAEVVAVAYDDSGGHKYQQALLYRDIAKTCFNEAQLQ
jgi:hypothetical protein